MLAVTAAYIAAEGVLVLSLRPKKVIARIPVVVRSVSLILLFVSTALVLSAAVSQLVIPLISSPVAIANALLVLLVAGTIGFALSSVSVSRILWNRALAFLHMANEAIK